LISVVPIFQIFAIVACIRVLLKTAKARAPTVVGTLTTGSQCCEGLLFEYRLDSN